MLISFCASGVIILHITRTCQVISNFIIKIESWKIEEKGKIKIKTKKNENENPPC
jgi:hypothetical protein